MSPQLLIASLLSFTFAINQVHGASACDVAGEPSHDYGEQSFLSDVDQDDFDLQHDSYEVPSDQGATFTAIGGEYKVRLSPAKYQRKQNAAFLRHDVAKMKKNERKYDLLTSNDLVGIRKLIQQYSNIVMNYIGFV